jgi:endonuclease/exonuclease/phosphatase family metal-dependent hydrolase
MSKNRILQYFMMAGMIVILFTHTGSAQSGGVNPEANRKLRIMFYNTENTFDTIDDPATRDDEFTPNGMRHWTGYRYFKKIQSLYKVIVSAGGWYPPELVGLCEIENERVLQDLTSSTPLSKFEYDFIHKDSPDQRGIDVALLYNPLKFKPLKTEFLPIPLPGKYRPTRDILYAKGETAGPDTLHVFINHWPSKWGGETETRRKRILSAKKLRSKVDSILKKEKNAKIIITGDFNDEPHKESLAGTLKAEKTSANIQSSSLYNLSYKWENQGTHKYQGQWAVLDQFIVSGALLRNKNLQANKHRAYIFQLPALLIEDEKHTGSKANRTYSGYRYLGGFSDHLPIILDLN